jgi:hypothetical protein
VAGRASTPAILTAAVAKCRSFTSHIGRSGAGTISRYLAGGGRWRCSSCGGGFRGGRSGHGVASSTACTEAGLAASTAVDRGGAAPSSARAAVAKGATLASTMRC